MQSLKAINQLVSALLNKPNAGVVVVDQDFSTGLKAKQLFDPFLNPQHPASKCCFQMWEFAGLRSDSLRKRAVRDAVASDIVCVSARGNAGLPAGVKSWAETWASQRSGHHCTMVVLLEAAEPELAADSRLTQFLRNVSTKGNADFLIAPLDPFGEVENSPACETTNRL